MLSVGEQNIAQVMDVDEYVSYQDKDTNDRVSTESMWHLVVKNNDKLHIKSSSDLGVDAELLSTITRTQQESKRSA
jgi:hypothetical protein